VASDKGTVPGETEVGIGVEVRDVVLAAPVGDGRRRKFCEFGSGPAPDEAQPASAASSTRVPAVCFTFGLLPKLSKVGRI
jgi:hypothetical protein